MPITIKTTLINNFTLSEQINVMKDDILNMEVFDSDVWVCTFPKCGTTWAQEMVWLLANELDYETAKSQRIGVRFPFIDTPLDPINTFNIIKNLKGRRFIKTHLPWSFLPLQIQNQERKPKIIFVTRNPKDALVSFYYHSINIHNDDSTFEEFFNNFLNDKVLYTPFWAHFSSYYHVRNIPNIITIKYEDMKLNLKNEILKLAKFLEITYKLNEESLVTLMEHLSFNSMQNNSCVNLQHFLKNDNFNFIRKGEVGDYKKHFTEEMNNRVNNWITENVKGFTVDHNFPISLDFAL